MSITVKVLTLNLHRPIYYAEFTPTPEEAKKKIWFGYVEERKDKKTGLVKKRIFHEGRKPTYVGRSGNTRAEAVRRLMSWVGAAYQGWDYYHEQMFVPKMTWNSKNNTGD